MRHRIQIALTCSLFAVMLGGLSCFQAVAANGSGTALRLRISTHKKRFIQGEQIPLDVELTNIGTRGVYVGRDMWTNASPSRVTVTIEATDGHQMAGIQGAVDGLAPGAFSKIAKGAVDWCLLLAPSYTYASDVTLQSFVVGSALVPGVYKVRAIFTSRGVEANSYLNPLPEHPQEISAFMDRDWKGEISSNELTIRIDPSPR